MSEKLQIGAPPGSRAGADDAYAYLETEGGTPRHAAPDAGGPGRKTAITSVPLGGVTKRTFDVLVSSTLLLFLCPVLLLIGVAVRLESRGPVIFKQNRIGFDGKKFTIFKFRTMMVQEDQNVVQAQRNDPRITRLGKFLRRSSLDELPQIMNVVRGDMSLIGPRPHAVNHDDDFIVRNSEYVLRRAARPGITGLAQISGARGPVNSDADLDKRVHFDTEYVQSWTFWNDVGILCRTLWAITRKNAAF